MVAVQAPEGDCPKCGAMNAFVGLRTMYSDRIGGQPRYCERNIVRDRPTKMYSDSYWEEYLAWPCWRCGYEEETPTADTMTGPSGSGG